MTAIAIALVIIFVGIIVLAGGVAFKPMFKRKPKPKPVAKPTNHGPYKFGLPFDLFEALEQNLPEKPPYTSWALSTMSADAMQDGGPETNSNAVRIAEPNDAILTISLLGLHDVELTNWFNVTRYEITPSMKSFDAYDELVKWAKSETKILAAEYETERSYTRARTAYDKHLGFRSAWNEIGPNIKKSIEDFNKEQMKKPAVIKDYLSLAEESGTDAVFAKIITPINSWANEVIKEYKLKYANVDYEVKII